MAVLKFPDVATFIDINEHKGKIETIAALNVTIDSLQINNSFISSSRLPIRDESYYLSKEYIPGTSIRRWHSDTPYLSEAFACEQFGSWLSTVQSNGPIITHNNLLMTRVVILSADQGNIIRSHISGTVHDIQTILNIFQHGYTPHEYGLTRSLKHPADISDNFHTCMLYAMIIKDLKQRTSTIGVF